jgi:hypothetical protein
MYTTVRLSNQSSGLNSWGTGFFFDFFKTNRGSVPAIVTNRHVAGAWDKCSVTLPAKTSNGLPNIQDHIDVEISDLNNKIIFHPTADLMIIAISETINTLTKTGRNPFTVRMEQSLIPTDDELKRLLPIEQIVTVGYPGQLWDNVHNLPLFHRGYTSTPSYIDFQGLKEFLIDVATWFGSRGSPVLLFNENGWADRNSNIVIGSSVKLLGIVYGVAVQDVTGGVRIQAAPTQIVVPAQMSVPTNLGACIMASRILEFEPLLIARGFTPPEDYIMRAK